MMKIDDYLKLLTSQHRDKPKLQATIHATLQPFIEIRDSIQQLMSYFDIETATGDQLLILAKWVGAPTAIPNAIPLPFFGFDGQDEALPLGETNDANIGGYWRESGVSGNATGAIAIPLLRKVIKAQIYRNSCGCTLDDAYAVLDHFIEERYSVFDSGQMWIGIGVLSSMRIATKELIKNMIPRPAGVGLKFYDNWFESFGWADQLDSLGFGDTNNPNTGGYWIQEM